MEVNWYHSKCFKCPYVPEFGDKNRKDKLEHCNKCDNFIKQKSNDKPIQLDLFEVIK